jgi:hypothetical protein
MPNRVELLRAEPDAGVRPVLGRFMFVYIYPYMNGNGQMCRFIMESNTDFRGLFLDVRSCSASRRLPKGARTRDRWPERTTV